MKDLQVDSFIPLWAWDVPPPKKKLGKMEKTGGTIEESTSNGIREKGSMAMVSSFFLLDAHYCLLY